VVYTFLTNPPRRYRYDLALDLCFLGSLTGKCGGGSGIMGVGFLHERRSFCLGDSRSHCRRLAGDSGMFPELPDAPLAQGVLGSAGIGAFELDSATLCRDPPVSFGPTTGA
jgi:hypothetical protein